MDEQPQHPFPRSVEAFSESLERAQAGGMGAFAIMWVDPNGVIGWKFHFGIRPQTDLIGGIACMEHAIIAGAMKPLEQPPIPEPATKTHQ